MSFVNIDDTDILQELYACVILIANMSQLCRMIGSMGECHMNNCPVSCRGLISLVDLSTVVYEVKS